MPMKPVRDEFIVAGEIAFHYVKWGEQGSPIVCVHGLTANAFYYQAFADKQARNHQLFAYDLRGRGDSDKPDRGYSVPIHAADLARLIDALGLERPIVIGHSLGALIALYFAAHYPERLSKLVLVDAGAPLPWNTPEEQPAWLTASISRLGTNIPSFEECILEEGRRFNEARPEEQWTGVQIPTLLLRAGQGLFSDNDQLLPEASAAAAQREIKQCHFVNFPTLNHYTIMLGVESGPVEDIRAFIDGK